MATGALIWGPTLRVLDLDGTTVPAAAVPLGPSFPAPATGRRRSGSPPRERTSAHRTS